MNHLWDVRIIRRSMEIKRNSCWSTTIIIIAVLYNNNSNNFERKCLAIVSVGAGADIHKCVSTFCIRLQKENKIILRAIEIYQWE